MPQGLLHPQPSPPLLPSGGRVWLFLETDDFDRDYRTWKTRGVQFLEEPRSEPYGKVVVFSDLYGNRWDLIEPVSQRPGVKLDPEK